MTEDQNNLLNSTLVDNAVTEIVFANQQFGLGIDSEFIHALELKLKERENEQPDWKDAFFAVTNSAQEIIKDKNVDEIIDKIETLVDDAGEKGWFVNFIRGLGIGFKIPKLFHKKH